MDPPPPPPPAQPPPPSAPPSASPLSAPISAAPIPPTSTTPATMGAPATAAATAAAATAGVGYPESIDSSPRSRTTDSYFDEQPTPPLPKLRLMCSYGGHIVPRPHDKSLCYVGGDTRIVVVDRHTTLSSLSVKLSNTLLNGGPFTLKYQLPSEDLDSLISVTTDEDLDNMIEEYDRTASNGSSGGGNKSRLRLFIFPIKPESSQSIGPLLESSAKSEDWFLNALNGATAAAGLLNRGFSDSASVNCLLGLDEDALIGGGNMGSGNSNRDVEVLNKNLKQSGGGGGGGGGGQDVHSVPDSPMLETTSSFGSSSSSPSLANLPPIRVHVDEPPPPQQQQKVVVGIEEQFAQINIGGGSSGSGGVGKQADESMVVLSSPPPMPVSIMPVGVNPMVMSEYQTRVISDDERSDHGVPVGYRKPPPPGQSQPPQQQTLVNQAQQQKSTGSGGGGGGGSGSGGGIDLHSPDSVSSDSSLSNAINRQKPAIYQESVAQIHSGASRVPGSSVDQKINVSDSNTRVQIQHQVQDSGYVLQSQFDQQQQQLQQQQQQLQQQQQQLQQQQQQYIPAGAHFIQHHPTGVPIPAYYSVYPPQPQQQHHHQLGQQYPMYYVQARQAQAYNLPVQQSSISDSATTIPSSRPQTPPPPGVVSSSAAYNPMRTAPVAKPEMANAGMYGTTASGTPQLVQVPPSQHQQQYVGYSQVHHPSQSVAPASAGGANYAYEYVDPAHAHLYYTQPLAHTIPAQYQTMTAAGAVGLPEASAQLPTDNIKQQIRTSQPI